MRSFFILLLLVPLSACSLLEVAYVNLFASTGFTVQGDRLLMEGPINQKSLRQFNRVYGENPGIRTIVQLDMPGSVDDDTMIALGYRVRELGLNTYLRSDSKIQSGAVDLFLAGVQRTIEPGAQIGVHAWAGLRKEATDFPRGAPEHEQNRRYIEAMLGSDAFYWFTIEAAPADGMHFMTPAEIATYGLATEPSP
jgi:hypothetical protein